MKKTLFLALVVVAAQVQQSRAASSPVADATRAFLVRDARNVIAAAEEMPADHYDFHPTPQQMTFAHLMAHLAHHNRQVCSGIAGEPAPKESGVTENDGKDKLVAEVKASFEYCTAALAHVDDSNLGEDVAPFHRTRANLMMALAADLADHYGQAAMYLRLNGLLPPTAQPKK